MEKKTLNGTLYTGPNPPSPSLLAASKLFVAATMVENLNRGTSDAISCLELEVFMLFE